MHLGKRGRVYLDRAAEFLAMISDTDRFIGERAFFRKAVHPSFNVFVFGDRYAFRIAASFAVIWRWFRFERLY